MAKNFKIFVALLLVLITSACQAKEEIVKDELVETDTNDMENMKIQIIVGDYIVYANLYDNKAARQFYEMLPQTFPMRNLYDREMCYRMGNGALLDSTAQDIGYETGDISYWPPAGSLVILYRQNGEVFEQVKIGHTDDDISFFDGLKEIDITFEKVN